MTATVAASASVLQHNAAIVAGVLSEGRRIDARR